MSNTADMLLVGVLFVVIAVAISVGFAAFAGLLAHREGAPASSVWARAGTAFAIAMGLFLAVGGFLISVVPRA